MDHNRRKVVFVGQKQYSKASDFKKLINLQIAMCDIALKWLDYEFILVRFDVVMPHRIEDKMKMSYDNIHVIKCRDNIDLMHVINSSILVVTDDETLNESIHEFNDNIVTLLVTPDSNCCYESLSNYVSQTLSMI